MGKRREHYFAWSRLYLELVQEKLSLGRMRYPSPIATICFSLGNLILAPVGRRSVFVAPKNMPRLAVLVFFLPCTLVFLPSRTDANGSKAMDRARLDAKRAGKREKLEAAV